ncbi:MAG: phosphate/phosphite/phosphonate ABC transporter substrate-binding protein [Bacillota bacterium]|nr:phosphate/phosphite/phosphonate ABC transporter substrate-binding protein [Bacillota bacterium]
MKKSIMATVSLALASILLAGCSASSKSSVAAAGVKDPDTITIAWLPNQAGDDFKDARAEIDNEIAKATGLKVADKLTTDYAITIEAVASGQAQLAYVGAQQYIEAHTKNSKVLPLVVNTGNSGTLSDALYYSRLCVTKANEGQYKSGSSYSIDNIAGKKMAFVSNSSTSGFKVPSSTIVSNFSKQDKYKNLTQDDMLENGKFFSQVIFGGSHQLSAVNLLNGKADVAAFDDIDLSSYVTLTSGTENTPGAVYTVKNDATDPFKALAGQQFVVIKAMPVMNGPLMVNTGSLSQKTIDAIKTALTSDEVTNNTKIFLPKDAKYKGMFNAPQKFVTVEDKWYDPIRELGK